MLLSTRESICVLRAAGVGANAARRALARGLAGPATAASGARFYDTAHVHELASRPAIRAVDVFELSPRGLFLARVDVDVTASPAEQRSWLERQLALVSPWNLAVLRGELQALGPLPLVASTGTFVTVGADVLDVVPLAVDGRRLVLDEPGDWFARFEGHRVCGGPGRPWHVYGSDLPWP